ncbi:MULTISPECIES: hypothetical protein [Campylobacter]|nr:MULTISPECIES: hypothetical protein [Campylobacter]MDD7422505.1 hypothetical protein [Campylobacter hominis]
MKTAQKRFLNIRKYKTQAGITAKLQEFLIEKTFFAPFVFSQL